MRLYFILFTVSAVCVCCTLDYGNQDENGEEFPEIVMEELEYVRMRNGEVSARLTAKLGERYETTHIMDLRDYTFEQYGDDSEDVDATGSGGFASVEMINNNVKMTEGVQIKIDSEDFSMETMSLDWDDKLKVLKGGEGDPVHIQRDDGTEVTGTDFLAEIRSRTWVFSSDAHGVYVYEDEKEEEQNSDSGRSEDQSLDLGL